MGSIGTGSDCQCLRLNPADVRLNPESGYSNNSASPRVALQLQKELPHCLLWEKFDRCDGLQHLQSSLSYSMIAFKSDL